MVNTTVWFISEISETKNRLLGETFEMYPTVNRTQKLLSLPILTLQPKKSNEVYILAEEICYEI